MRFLPLSFTCAFAVVSAAAQTPQPPGTGSPQTPSARGAGPSSQPRSTGTPPAVTVEVTDKSGNPVEGVSVGADGPVERSGNTGNDGTIVFRSMRPGNYRLRFEREGFTTLERDIVVRAGQPMSVSAALTAAPVTPSPVVPPPVSEPPPAPAKPPARNVDPRSLSIPDFLDKNLIGGGEPQKLTLLGCAEGGTARLLQIRDPLSNEQHADVDEILYVVAGAGVLHIRNQDVRLNPGHFVLVPRGIAHGLRREGRNPLITVSVLAGTPCSDLTASRTNATGVPGPRY
jgi:mannose-6-phosphate isomerase-like protein (cupin superfamily)